MAERNSQKLAAARKMLKEYQKKNRENSSSVQNVQQLQHQSSPSPPLESYLLKNVETTAGHDVRTNDESAQNYVYDSGTNINLDSAGSLFTNENVNNAVHGVLNGHGTIESPTQNKNGLNGNSDKTNEHYVNQLVSELKTHRLFTDNSFNISDNTSNNNNNNTNVSNKSEIKSAKDFFDSLPVSSQSSVDFSFDAQLTSDMPSGSVSNSATVTEVPSVVGVTSFNVKNNQDSQSDRSESVPITPSEHDKSDISTSTPGQSPKKVSEVLELQLQELDSKLGAEMTKNKILTEQLQKSHSHISQLEESIEVTKKESDAKVAVLEEKLQLHVKTLEILVSEKTELQTTLTTCQESISHKAGEIEELQSRLRASRHRVGDLERELGLAQALRLQQEKAAHEATCSSDILKNEVDLLRKRSDESLEEVLDLKHKIEEKSQEVVSLKEELQEKNSQLSLSQLRVEQLSSSEDSVDGHKQGQDLTIALQNDKKELEQQLEQLNKDLKRVASERDEASSQYQQYVTTLNSQLQSMAAKYEIVCNQRDNLSAREASLVEHIASLEKQLQHTLTRKPSPPPPAPVLPLQQQNLELQKIQQQLEVVSTERKQLEEQLNSQLSENTKLTDALEEFTTKVIELERTIERLETDRPDASLLQAAIESDKVAASRAIAQNTDLKKQLEELQDAFVKMSNSKLELTEKLEMEQHHCEELSKQLAQVNKSEVCEHEVKQNFISENAEKIDFCSQTYNVKDVDMSDVTIDLEAMAKLEEKFKKKMQELAELSDEKQRLEHLVLQLQCETETIGEYITLYQIQRSMLRQRTQEKDEQMARLSQEREVLRNKLNELNHLVQTLLPGSEIHCPLSSLEKEITNSGSDQATDALETVCTSNQIDLNIQTTDGINKEETAGKIRALLTEIGSNKLVTPDGENPNFHPCPWCSGRLITV